MAIPTLDFAKFHSGSDAERREFASSLTDGFKRLGFVKLVNHGFSKEEISHLFQVVCGLSSNSSYPPLLPDLTSESTTE